MCKQGELLMPRLVKCHNCEPALHIHTGVVRTVGHGARLVQYAGNQHEGMFWVNGTCPLCANSGLTTQLVATTHLLGGMAGVEQLRWLDRPRLLRAPFWKHVIAYIKTAVALKNHQ